MGRRREELEAKIRWWEQQASALRDILRAYIQSNARLHNEIGRLRGMLCQVSRVSPGVIDSALIQQILRLLEDPHIGDNP